MQGLYRSLMGGVVGAAEWCVGCSFAAPLDLGLGWVRFNLFWGVLGAVGGGAAGLVAIFRGFFAAVGEGGGGGGWVLEYHSMGFEHLPNISL